MADIRQNASFIDDFNRADETPLSGGGKWSVTDTSIWANGLVLKNNTATHGASNSADSYWIPDNYDGDDAEFWAYQEGGGASGIAWGLGLWHQPGGSGAVDGYRFRYERAAVNIVWRLYRFDNASPTTIYDSGSLASNSTFTNGLGILLIRRKGNDVEGWGCAQSDPTTWTRYAVATDTTYMTDLHFGLGVNDNSGGQILGWDNPGGGPQSNWHPEFMRRPWNYQGKQLIPNV